jgi:hypothetical protein
MSNHDFPENFLSVNPTEAVSFDHKHTVCVCEIAVFTKQIVDANLEVNCIRSVEKIVLFLSRDSLLCLQHDDFTNTLRLWSKDTASVFSYI